MMSRASTRPDLSVIVVTWNNENYIEQCLRSCLPQKDCTKVEVIVVHNASDDRTLEVLQRVTKKYPDIFKVVENEANEGLGEGRNIGLKHATGRFITFLDGDDYYYHGAIEHITSQCNDTSPDLLIFDYKRFWPTGAHVPNPHHKLLDPLRDASSVEERNKLMPNMGVAWNKAYKRSYLDEIGVQFTRRYYEDIDWHFHCLLRAETVRVSPRVCVAYRQRIGSITRSRSDRHFDIFDQYSDVLALLKSDDFLMKHYGNAIYKYGRGQILNVIHSGDRLDKSFEKSYAKKAVVLLSDWRLALENPPQDTRLKVLSIASPSVYKMAIKLQKKYPYIRNDGQGLAKNILYRIRNKVNRTLYQKLFTKLPIKSDTYLFESYWGRKFDCNPAAIAKKLAESGRNKVYFSLNDTEATAVPANITRLKRHSLKYYYVAARAKFLTSNVNFAGDIIKRPGAEFVQTFHGTPIKVMGIDIRDTRPNEFNWKSFSKKFQQWDYGISANEHSSYVWRRSHPANYKIVECGYPRNDDLFSESFRKLAREKLEVAPFKKVVLYAPTFRDSPENAAEFSKNVPEVVASISKMLGSDWLVLVRLHHFNKTVQISGNNIRDVCDYPSITELLSATDLLISDYSSLLFDFACTNRPIILFTPDYAAYNQGRGVYFDIRKEAPGVVCGSLRELEDSLNRRTYIKAPYLQKLTAFRAKYCPWDDGSATDRVIKEIYKECD